MIESGNNYVSVNDELFSQITYIFKPNQNLSNTFNLSTQISYQLQTSVFIKLKKDIKFKSGKYIFIIVIENVHFNIDKMLFEGIK